MLGKEIAGARKRLRLSQADFAEKLGVSRNAVHLWETNRSEPTRKNRRVILQLLPGRRNKALAQMLGMDVEEMVPMPKSAAKIVRSDIVPTVADVVPLFRTVADGSAGMPWVFRVTGEVVDMVNAPYQLRNRKDLRALEVPTDHMAPRYFKSEMIWISQARMVSEGDWAVIYRHHQDGKQADSEYATLGRVIALTPNHVEIEQYKPARTFKIARKDISAVWRIVPAAEFA